MDTKINLKGGDEQMVEQDKKEEPTNTSLGQTIKRHTWVKIALVLLGIWALILIELVVVKLVQLHKI